MLGMSVPAMIYDLNYADVWGRKPCSSYIVEERKQRRKEVENTKLKIMPALSWFYLLSHLV